jgi:hypothetical protein
MISFRLALCACLAFAVASPVTVAAAPPKAPPAAPAASSNDVEPDAVQALTRMTAYLGTLNAFDIKAETSMDLIMTDGQKLKLDGANHYTVRRPDGFVIEVATPLKVRRLIYDGKSLTLLAPELGVYATVAAPATIRETMDEAGERYGLVVPLADLFRWMDPNQKDREPLLGAMLVGPSKVGGVDCDHYAYREEEVDWQIWIEKGARPIPRKIVIIDRLDPTRPQFEARLDWDLAPKLTNDTFAFRPDSSVKQIRLTSAKP